jgi:hypothetical protein
MKVEVIRGVPDSHEYEISLRLKQELESRFPSKETDQRFAWIFPNHDCSGTKIRDVDILMYVDLRTEVDFNDIDGRRKKCFVTNFAASIEVTRKDQYSTEGNNIICDYN